VYGVLNIEAPTCNHCCSVKAVSITYSEFAFVALGVQHAMRMRYIILSSAACPALQNFSTLSHKRYDLLRKILNLKCVFWFSLQTFPKYFSF